MAVKKGEYKKVKDKKMGRPTLYTKDLIDKLCRIIATSENGIHRICEKNKKEFPDPTQLFRWLLDIDDKEKDYFRHEYARAKNLQAEFMFDKLNKIIEPKKTDKQSFGVGNQHIARARLQVDTIKWQMSKLFPKTYGDKVQVDQTIKSEPPLFPDVPKDNSNK